MVLTHHSSLHFSKQMEPRLLTTPKAMQQEMKIALGRDIKVNPESLILPKHIEAALPKAQLVLGAGLFSVLKGMKTKLVANTMMILGGLATVIPGKASKLIGFGLILAGLNVGVHSVNQKLTGGLLIHALKPALPQLINLRDGLSVLYPEELKKQKQIFQKALSDTALFMNLYQTEHLNNPYLPPPSISPLIFLNKAVTGAVAAKHDKLSSLNDVVINANHAFGSAAVHQLLPGSKLEALYDNNPPNATLDAGHLMELSLDLANRYTQQVLGQPVTRRA